jgi:hypothetical protein
VVDDAIKYEDAFQGVKNMLGNGRLVGALWMLIKVIIFAVGITFASWMSWTLASVSEKVDAIDKRVERVERKLDR